MIDGKQLIPKVTVLMPVYNGAKFLKESIESILQQTFTNYEFLIINDGSSDNSEEIIRSYNDSRVKLVNNEHNMGLIATLNLGLELAKGEYVARMDQDDISMPERLAKQVKYLDGNPEVAVCGTWFETFGVGNSVIHRHPVDYKEAKCLLLFQTVLGHPTVMMRREVLAQEHIFYPVEYENAEDYAFWVKIAKNLRITNLPEVLLKYRNSPSQISTKFGSEQEKVAARIMYEQIREVGIEPSDQEMKTHLRIHAGEYIDAKTLENWLAKLRQANLKSNYFSEPQFSEMLEKKLALAAKKEYPSSNSLLRRIIRKIVNYCK